MRSDREKCLASDSKNYGVDNESPEQPLAEQRDPQPGKQTLVEKQLLARLADGPHSGTAVGRQTLLDQNVDWPQPTPLAASTYSLASPSPGSRSVFDELRLRALHDTFAALALLRGGHGLIDATRSAARRASRPELISQTGRPAPPDPVGQALWRATERRAATLYRQAMDSGEVEHEDPAVEMALARAGSGQPLPEVVRRNMELELQISLERVRIHTDAVAADATKAVRARAFTVGEDIFFAEGEYAPETPAGQRLLAHELSHVVQGYQGRIKPGGTGVKVSSPDEALEREADEVAERMGERRAPSQGVAKLAPAFSRPIEGVHVLRKASAPGRAFGEASSPVGKLGRVQAPKGVFLRMQPIAGAASPSPPLPFNALVYVESRTTQAHANERWCYVIATELGTTGFCEERYLAIDPPEPGAKLRRTQQGERLAVIAEEAYGPANDEDNSRLYVQALYIANRDRAGVKLDHVELSFKDRATRGGAEEETLKVYKGVKVLAGTSIWIPSKEFIERLKAVGAVTGRSTYMMEAWSKAKDFANDVVEGVKYAAGFIVGLLEGAFNAIVDLFKGAVEMVEAVVKIIWNLVTGNPDRIKDMLMGWVGKMKLAWEHRGQIADEFLKKWNAESMWDRGLFQGEVLGWVMMTVLLVLITMGEDAPAALSGIAVRWPQLIKLLRTVDTLGDVTTYLGAAAKTVMLPKKAAVLVAGKVGKATRTTRHAAAEITKDVGRAGSKVEEVVAHGPQKHVPGEADVPHAPELPTTAQKTTGAGESSPASAHGEAVPAKVKPEDSANWDKVKGWVGQRLGEKPPEGYIIFERDGKRFLRRIDADDAKWPRLTVDDQGVIQVGRATSPRISVAGRLVKNMGPGPAAHQGHHLIPDTVVRDHPLLQAARARGKPPYDVDRATNGIYLPETTAARSNAPTSEELPLHRGSHPEYSSIATRAANDKLRRLLMRFGEIDKIPSEALSRAAAEIEDSMKEIVKHWISTHGDKLK
jgi:hypothetical protein